VLGMVEGELSTGLLFCQKTAQALVEVDHWSHYYAVKKNLYTILITSTGGLLFLKRLMYEQVILTFLVIVFMVFVYNIPATPHNFYVSVSDLFIPRIASHIFLRKNRQTDHGNI
jgi:hypothetical protein